MSRERQETQQTTTVTPTAEETELNRLLLERTRAGQAGAIQTQESGFNLINQLLTGGELPGNLAGLAGGIDEDVTNRIVQQSIEDVRSQAQSQGLLNSGVLAQLESETSAGIRAGAEQFNIQNLQQLLNLAAGGQAQNQALIGQGTGQLGQSLSGLRGVTTGIQQTFQNPFLKSFQTSFGQSLGSGSFGSSGDTGQAAKLAAGGF